MAVPVFSNIFAEDTIANSNYNGLQISLDKSFSHGLLFSASYTFSKAIDQGASFENELNPLNFNATRGLSLLDAKNRFVFSPYWELPVPKYDGFKGKALNGWGMSAIITYQSGFPIRVQTQNDLELQSSFFFEDANTPQVTGKVQFTNPKSATNVAERHSTFTLIQAISAIRARDGFGNMPHALCCGPAIEQYGSGDFQKEHQSMSGGIRSSALSFTMHGITRNLPIRMATFRVRRSDKLDVLKTREGPRVIQFGLKVLF